MTKRCEDCKYHAGKGELMGIPTWFCRAGVLHTRNLHEEIVKAAYL